MLFFGNLSNVVVFSVTCEAIADLSCAIWLTDMSKWQSIMYAICCKVVVYGYLHKTVSAGAALKIYNGKHKKPEIMYSFRPLRYILWLDEMGMTGFACLDAIRHGMYRTLVLSYKPIFSKGFKIRIDFFHPQNAFSNLSTMIPLHNVLLCTTTSFLLSKNSPSNGKRGKRSF